jgi:hypothetical protein
MLADLESLIPSACLAIGFVMLVKTILKHQNPQRRAAHREREAAAEFADPRIMQNQVMPSDLRPGNRAKKAPAKKAPAKKAPVKRAAAAEAPAGKEPATEVQAEA